MEEGGGDWEGDSGGEAVRVLTFFCSITFMLVFHIVTAKRARESHAMALKTLEIAPVSRQT